MKHIFLSSLFTSLGLLVSIEGLVCPSEAAAPPRTSFSFTMLPHSYMAFAAQ